MNYRYEVDGRHLRLTADSAAAAAAALARQRWGGCGGVESLRMIGRSYRYLGHGLGGAGNICGKVWRAVIVKQPTPEQRYGGVGYVREAMTVRLFEGMVKSEEVPAADWPFCAERQQAVDAMVAAAAANAAAAAEWRRQRHERWRQHAAAARARLG